MKGTVDFDMIATLELNMVEFIVLYDYVMGTNHASKFSEVEAAAADKAFQNFLYPNLRKIPGYEDE